MRGGAIQRPYLALRHGQARQQGEGAADAFFKLLSCVAQCSHKRHWDCTLAVPTVRDDLRGGTLVEILKSQAIPERPLYAAFAPGAPVPEKVPSFVDLLADWFRNDLGIRVLVFSAAGGHQRE
jgi:DNA-binding transcriptional LysR family regulator